MRLHFSYIIWAAYNLTLRSVEMHISLENGYKILQAPVQERLSCWIVQSQCSNITMSYIHVNLARWVIMCTSPIYQHLCQVLPAFQWFSIEMLRGPGDDEASIHCMHCSTTYLFWVLFHLSFLSLFLSLHGRSTDLKECWAGSCPPGDHLHRSPSLSLLLVLPWKLWLWPIRRDREQLLWGRHDERAEGANLLLGLECEQRIKNLGVTLQPVLKFLDSWIEDVTKRSNKHLQYNYS